MTKMPATREALLSHGVTHDVRAASAEVAAAEDIIKMLSTLVDAHWHEVPHETVRGLVREAERMLAKFGA